MSTFCTVVTFVFCSFLLVVRTSGQETISSPGAWARVTAPAPFAVGAAQALLMTDGTVMVQDFCSSDWWSLTPDINGSYINGTWTQKASMPSDYGPLFNASAVLADGKLIVNGGEYNLGGANCQGALTTLGAIYDPLANTWTPVAPPANWQYIGDAQSVVLSDGTYMLANPFTKQQAMLDEGTMTWTTIGNGKHDVNDEEGWTLLPSGEVLTVDVIGEPNTELYNPKTRTWSSAGKTPFPLTGGMEIGPQVLRPDGTVFVIGYVKYTAVYDSIKSTWLAGPQEPYVDGHALYEADGPATLLRNGDIIIPLSSGVSAPTYFFLSDGKTFTRIAAPPNAVNDEEEQFHTLMLPTGQVLVTDWSNDVEIYTSPGGQIKGIEPVITSAPTTLIPGETYTIIGSRFNGFSQTNFYGDDAQDASNYPLVRITNNATHHIFYARTHNHSYMGVASPRAVSTKFDVPTSIESGPSTLVVVANGFSSEPVHVEIK